MHKGLSLLFAAQSHEVLCRLLHDCQWAERANGCTSHPGTVLSPPVVCIAGSAFRVVFMPPVVEVKGDAVIVTVRLSSVCLSVRSCSPGRALRCVCSNNLHLWRLMTCPVCKRYVEGRMCCFSNHRFPLNHSVTSREDELPTFESWKSIEQHLNMGDVWKQMKQTSLPENLPKTSVCLFFLDSPNMYCKCSKILVVFSFFLNHLLSFFCCFIFLLTKYYLQYRHYFFGYCLSWVLESHRLEMSKCKTVIDLWDVMQNTSRCLFLFFLLQ